MDVWTGYQLANEPEGDAGHFISPEKLQKKRFEKMFTELEGGVMVRNSDGSYMALAFANYYPTLSYNNQLALLTDDGAQIFDRNTGKKDENDLAECVDAFDKDEFHYIVSDFDGDGDEDLMIAGITENKYGPERLDLMTFENNGEGTFHQIGFDPKKDYWAVASARCYGGLCQIEDEFSRVDFQDLYLRQDGGKFYYGFETNRGETAKSEFSLKQNSTQIDQASHDTEHYIPEEFILAELQKL